MDQVLRERILSRVTKVEFSLDTPCWVSDRAASGYHGHTGLRYGGVLRATHIWAYEEWVGPTPDGLVLDHLCDNPPCCNPFHLEPKTLWANTARGRSFAATNAAKTHCPRGHEFTDSNTYWRSNKGRAPSRRCRRCTLDQNASYR